MSIYIVTVGKLSYWVTAKQGQNLDVIQFAVDRLKEWEAREE